MSLTVWLLILHGLLAVALLGAITHQAVSTLTGTVRPAQGFSKRYLAVTPRLFVNAVVVTYLVTFVLGSVIYPVYRLDVRIAFAEMQLGWAIGLFEIKEHWAALGLALLPLYSYLWKSGPIEPDQPSRTAVTVTLAIIVWFNFLVGHILNNFRGL